MVMIIVHGDNIISFVIIELISEYSASIISLKHIQTETCPPLSHATFHQT